MYDWHHILINKEISIFEAIAIIDKGALQLALVVDDNQKLVGLVTDGDVRRGILKKIAFSESVSKIMHVNPHCASVSDSERQKLTKMRKYNLSHLPVLDVDGRVVDLKILKNFLQETCCDHWVVLMAGGIGTRLYPFTQHCPKPLLKVGQKPILEIILENFIEQGFYEFFFSVNYKGHMIQDYFGDGSKWGVNIHYLQESKALGTAGALSLLPQKPTKPFYVMNTDLITGINFKHLLDFHKKCNAKITMCISEYHHTIPYGVVDINQHQFVSIREKPTKSFFVNAGIYLLEPSVLDFIPNNQAVDMPKILSLLTEQGFHVSTFPIREYWLDVGRIEDLERAREIYSES